MGKPILFDTISRAKFDGLSDDVKAKRNYQIKEEDGTISKHIAGLEGGSGGGVGDKYITMVSVDSSEFSGYKFYEGRHVCPELVNASLIYPLSSEPTNDETYELFDKIIKNNYNLTIGFDASSFEYNIGDTSPETLAIFDEGFLGKKAQMGYALRSTDALNIINGASGSDLSTDWYGSVIFYGDSPMGSAEGATAVYFENNEVTVN